MSSKRTHTNIAKALSQCVLPITKDALRKRGFFEYRLIEEWPLVVGEHLARCSIPLKVAFEMQKRSDGVLHIQVLSSMALEFQHLQPMILDRIASYFGYKAIARMVLHQTSALPSPDPIPVAKPSSVASIPVGLEPTLAACTDDDLRQSLTSLAQVISTKNNH